MQAGDNNPQRNLKRLMLAALQRERKMFARQTRTRKSASQTGNPVQECLNISRIKRGSCHPLPAHRVRALLFAPTRGKNKTRQRYFFVALAFHIN
jgi:hypothetical protein